MIVNKCSCQDVSASLSKKYPELYMEGIRNSYFKWRIVGTLACFSLYQSIVVYTFVTSSSSKSVAASGKMFGHWDISTMAFTCLVITVNLRLLMQCNTITRWHHISVGGSILLWFIFIFIYSLVLPTKVSQSLSISTYFIIVSTLGPLDFGTLLMIDFRLQYLPYSSIRLQY